MSNFLQTLPGAAPTAAPLPFVNSAASISSAMPTARTSQPTFAGDDLRAASLWQLIVELLPCKDVETEWYSLKEIAPLVNLKPRALMKHCRDLWPRWEGQYRLNFSQAVSLIRRVCFAGRKLPARASIEARVRKLRAAHNGQRREARCH